MNVSISTEHKNHETKRKNLIPLKTERTPSFGFLILVDINLHNPKITIFSNVHCTDTIYFKIHK